jgi:hypothetical protein
MKNMFAMQRANGDWFAFADNGRLRMPVFSSNVDAMQARMNNAGMMLFKPVALDEHAVKEIVSDEDKSDVYFWLVDNSANNVNRGHTIELTELSLLMHEAAQRTE